MKWVKKVEEYYVNRENEEYFFGRVFLTLEEAQKQYKIRKERRDIVSRTNERIGGKLKIRKLVCYELEEE